MSAMAEVRVNRGSTWSTLAPVELRLHDEAEADRVALGHVRAHDQDGVGEPDVHLVGRGAAATERSAQTGHGRAVSDPGLVFEPDQPEGPPELELDVVPLVVHRRPAQRGDRGAVVDRLRRRPCRRGPCPSRSRGRSRRGSPSSARRSGPSPSRAASRPSSVANGARYLTLVSRFGLTASWKVAEPLGQSVPRLIGLSGLPSMLTIWPSRTLTIWPQPPRSTGRRSAPRARPGS